MAPDTVNLKAIAHALGLDEAAVEAATALLDAGATPTFIARYRRDATGGLDELQIGAVRDRVRRARELEQRRGALVRLLEGQRRLTDELRQQLQQAGSARCLEDLYLPYKPKKDAQAERAREQGLDKLADEILSDAPACADLDRRAADFVDEDKQTPDVATALAGAGAVLAERFSESVELRRKARKMVHDAAELVAHRAESAPPKKAAAYKDFFKYRERASRAPAHRVLATGRGEREKALAVSVECDPAPVEEAAVELLAPEGHSHREFLAGCVRDGVRRLLVPQLVAETRRDLTEKAEDHALVVFARNLRRLLLQPPVAGLRVLAIDPGAKNSARVAALDERGAVLAVGSLQLTRDEPARGEARQQLAQMAAEHGAGAIAIGNGRGRRACEQLVAELLASELADQDVRYTVVNEAGANVYASSSVGREELPELDAPHRAAVSVGRRLQDPLAELVKIDPASVGVGLYQHDTRSAVTRDALAQVVESCVSQVGVELNEAGPALLARVSGLNPLTARRVVEHREAHGPFKRREQLQEVAGLGDAAYEQAAGFLKISGGEEPLDATWVHPESYETARRLLERAGVEPSALASPAGAERFAKAMEAHGRDELAAELGVGRRALDQIIEALARPGRDPRDDRPPPVFRRDMVKLDDLAEGMELAGVVLNVVDFGAFVDIGLSDTGLVHVSQLSAGYVRDPHAVVAVGDRVRVWVTSIDKQRRRVALTMIKPGTPREGRGKPAGEKRKPRAGGRSRSDDRKPKPRKERRKRHDDRRAPRGPRVYEQRAERPTETLTKEMEEGKEAMRTFGDLLQFVQKQKKPDGDKGSGGNE